MRRCPRGLLAHGLYVCSGGRAGGGDGRGLRQHWEVSVHVLGQGHLPHTCGQVSMARGTMPCWDGTGSVRNQRAVCVNLPSSSVTAMPSSPLRTRVAGGQERMSSHSVRGPFCVRPPAALTRPSCDVLRPPSCHPHSTRMPPLCRPRASPTRPTRVPQAQPTCFRPRRRRPPAVLF